MDHTFLQSTLRELQVIQRSPRFWATFVTIVLIFAVTGPYGTLDRLMPGARLGYWLALHAMAWSCAVVFSVAAEILLRRAIASMFARMMIGSVVAALPIGFGITLVELAFFGTAPSLTASLHHSLDSIPLCVLFCVLTYLTMHRQILMVAEGLDATEAKATLTAAAEIRTLASQPPILLRLKPENRGALVRLTVRDHYTEVVTTRGRELILLRFGDALTEIGNTEGIRLHRSHWIATEHVDRLKRDNGKLFVIARDGVEMPVSRSYVEAVQRRFG
ncbi:MULTISPECIES: LytTR family DNA-binding domain-containing protein [Rhizobium]|uniref:DNA-binding LytR/AlgR family response regulator n=1 Tax=Rhizobium paranaense TaxID=1650438 RepID=A0A7W8XPK8_9HYPH|nr:LytTR family DNA-binding domain-containing protein [Rhizobium sp. SEMIA4064]MBB5573253.1 DNA-binding LytR/AlgR family response regulator [Rhizobium paranaense]PST62384.1 DNA-binding protein [Rhizobium sp. SEMIA4064]